jgi:NAD(P)-dependent dehydrogenase (short-subunit alcohol dehydrogenase family)
VGVPSHLQKYDLRERVAIVTGGAGLLGRGYCQTLAAAGTKVVIADIEVKAAEELAQKIMREIGVDVVGIHTDVSNPESVHRMIQEVLRRFDRIDILVNNAALDPKFDPDHAGEHSNRFEDFPFTAWQEALGVNVTGMFLCAQGVSVPMLEANHGVIINISSTYGLVGPDQRLYQREGQSAQFKPVTYTVAKAAVLGLTRYLATYFTNTGIRVNTLTPGGVFAGHDDEFVQRYSAKTVLGRMADADEMSSALLFLASDASSYMTGANLVVDGGWTAW